MKATIHAAVLAVLLGLTGPAVAEDFPSRSMVMIIPFAAGGPTDVLGRIIAQRMGEVLGQTIVVENVGGAGGMAGSKRVADARPDGYTFEIGTVGTHAQNQSLYQHPLYNSVTDFTPVALIAEVPIVLIARKDLPVKNLQEFVAYAKANQATMHFGSGGAGAASHLGCVVLNVAMGTDITHVPYKGGGLAMQDVIAGRIDIECEIMTTVKSHIDSGRREGAGDPEQDPLAGRAGSADRLGAGPRRASLYVECGVLAQGRAGGNRDQAQRRRRAGDEDAGRARSSAGPGRANGLRRPRHAGVSRRLRQERDREMGGADQSERRDGEVRRAEWRRGVCCRKLSA